MSVAGVLGAQASPEKSSLYERARRGVLYTREPRGVFFILEKGLYPCRAGKGLTWTLFCFLLPP